jgi:hypothetical protein
MRIGLHRSEVTMEQMRAVVVQPSVASPLVVQQCPAPSALPSEALVRGAAASLNRGEVRRSLTAIFDSVLSHSRLKDVRKFREIEALQPM